MCTSPVLGDHHEAPQIVVVWGPRTRGVGEPLLQGDRCATPAIAGAMGPEAPEAVGESLPRGNRRPASPIAVAQGVEARGVAPRKV